MPANSRWDLIRVLKGLNKDQHVSDILMSIIMSVRTDHDQHHCYHHVPTVNQSLLLQLIGS